MSRGEGRGRREGRAIGEGRREEKRGEAKEWSEQSSPISANCKHQSQGRIVCRRVRAAKPVCRG
jgi:hypothetical protein